MKKLLLGTVALAALGVAPAVAADLPARVPAYTKAPAMVVAIYNWSGFYAGVQAGYAWTRAPQSVFGAPVAGVWNGNGNSDGTGAKLGGHVGFNMQSGALVYGIEGDMEWANVNGGNTGVVSLTAPNKLDLRWEGSIRGRFGFAMDRTLVYATAGWAWAGARSNEQVLAPVNVNKTIDGWTVGGGLEHAFAPNMTARVEYRYTDFGNEAFSRVAYTERYAVTEHALRVGLTYKFGGPVVARY